MKQSDRKLPFALTVISAGLLAVGTAWGQGMEQDSGAMGAQEHPTFSQLDVNQDGQISRDEASSSEELATNMDQADTDGNGSISESEFSAFEVQQGWTAPAPGGEMQQQEQPSGME